VGKSPEWATALLGFELRQKWRIEALLGIGGMAAVYRATHRNGHSVAIKILRRELAGEAGLVRRFVREAYAANAVEHPSAAQVMDNDVTDDGIPFLVMELLRGEPLDVRVKRLGGKLPIPEVARLVAELLDGLASAHQKGIIHRDIKPQNLFVLENGNLKILDFGIARLGATAGDENATQLGSVLGTPGFMAPEQARGRTDLVDAQTDLWAVGATMFFLLSGKPVHVGGTLNERLAAAMTQRARSLAEVAPDLPEAIVTVVDRALAFEKEARWESAAEMRRALEAANHISTDLSTPIAHTPRTVTLPGPPPVGLAAEPLAPPPAVAGPGGPVSVHTTTAVVEGPRSLLPLIPLFVPPRRSGPAHSAWLLVAVVFVGCGFLLVLPFSRQSVVDSGGTLPQTAPSTASLWPSKPEDAPTSTHPTDPDAGAAVAAPDTQISPETKGVPPERTRRHEAPRPGRPADHPSSAVAQSDGNETYEDTSHSSALAEALSTSSTPDPPPQPSAAIPVPPTDTLVPKDKAPVDFPTPD